MRNTLSALCLVASLSLVPAAQDPAKIAFFESEVRPLLVEHCYKCHSASKGESKGGLTLDTQAGWMNGGDSGAAIVPGKVAESLIIEAVEQGDPDFTMPPKYKLAEAEIAVLKKWVAMGAPDPRDGSAPKLAASEIDIEAGRGFWSFKPVATPATPDVQDTDWPANSIDQFVLAGLEAAGLKPVGNAERRTLIRRANFDLIGLPPTPEEIHAFVNDPAPDSEAFAKVVDRLLASRHFGERWGRHWLDVVRYGESMGRTRNYPFPFAWRYRDYVIAAFNTDKPYDQFVREQLAGDLMESSTPEQADQRLIATGLLALGSMDLNERDREKYKMDVVDDQIDVTSRAFMALTAGCARCHDHKFDPLPTADYYALAGIFASSDTLSGYASRQGGGNQAVNGALLHSLRSGPAGEEVAVTPPKPSGAERNARKRLQELQQRKAQLEQQITAAGPGNQMQRLRKQQQQVRGQIKRTENQIRKLAEGRSGGSKLRTNMAMGVRDAKRIAASKICVRGDVDNRGAEVPRGFPQVLVSGAQPALPEDSSGRLQLAEWIASPAHPLTARVMTNRVWHHLFGSGIVRSVDNFGATGELPSHPELLDYLAGRFAGQHAWSTKALVREIVLSRTYRAASTHHEANAAKDPDNRFFWRANVRRLEAEALRDALMSVAGSLELAPAVGSPVQGMKGQINTGAAAGQIEAFPHRSVYLPIVRNNIPEILEVFDFAEPASVIGKRDITTVSTQALYLLNDRFVINQSLTSAKRLLGDKRLENREERIAGAYLMAFGRTPSGAEQAAARRYLNDAAEEGQPAAEAWGGFMQALFASAEFRYVL